MNEQITAISKRVLQKISPQKEERLKVETLSRRLEEKIAAVCKAEGIAATVRVEGSVAKDTWLSGNPDIDVFIRLPTSIPRRNFGDVGLKIAKKAAGDAEQLERFAEHPYLEVNIEGYHVDIVPCYDAKPGEWQSATDRTPYHTDYIRTHLKKTLRDEVRLLKQFMVGIGVYGAEIKVGGFSGYLCELLVMKFGSFAETVEAFARYNQRIVVDIEGVYSGREKELCLLFTEPLVIVDPVDKGRNVASAVQPQKLYTFIAASRAFHTQPIEDFFYPPKTHAVAPNLIADRLAECGAAYVFVVIGELTAVPDVLWGQLYRTKRSLRKLLETNEFKVLKEAVWSNETSLSVFTFELEQQVLPNIKKHMGPQLERGAESEKFLKKYASDNQVLSGPYVEDGRWVVEVPRKSPDAVALFREKLADGGKNAGVAELVAKAMQQEFKVLVGDEVLKVYVENSDFAVFLTAFLLCKPFWLETH
jgi:tRNA nucleotidyltransferase (CCA-adding enzyme)